MPRNLYMCTQANFASVNKIDKLRLNFDLFAQHLLFRAALIICLIPLFYLRT